MARSAFFGLAAIIVFYVFTALAVLLSPWFSWIANALSDLGNVSTSGAAAIFNFGLMASGFLLLLYSVIGLRVSAPVTSYLLAFTGLSLQFVGAFNETYGTLHLVVSVILFLSLLVSSLAYFAERRSYLALIVLFGIVPWVMLAYKIFFTGAALPEIFSSFLVMPWILSTIASVKKGEKLADPS